jgi:hypothetical protein
MFYVIMCFNWMELGMYLGKRCSTRHSRILFPKERDGLQHSSILSDEQPFLPRSSRTHKKPKLTRPATSRLIAANASKIECLLSIVVTTHSRNRPINIRKTEVKKMSASWSMKGSGSADHQIVQNPFFPTMRTFMTIHGICMLQMDVAVPGNS